MRRQWHDTLLALQMVQQGAQAADEFALGGAVEADGIRALPDQLLLCRFIDHGGAGGGRCADRVGIDVGAGIQAQGDLRRLVVGRAHRDGWVHQDPARLLEHVAHGAAAGEQHADEQKREASLHGASARKAWS